MAHLDPKEEVILTARTPTDGLRFPFYPFDLTDLGALDAFLNKQQPEVIIHTAAMGSIDRAELHKLDAQIINVEVPARIAKWCSEHGARMIHFSSDFVFDGSRLDWDENDVTAPLSWYGKTKVASEEQVRSMLDDHVIIRPILVYGAAAIRRRLNLPLLIISKLEAGQEMQITDDQVRMPTYVEDVAWATCKLIDHNYRGIIHISGPEVINVYRFSVLVAQVFKLDHGLLLPIQSDLAKQVGMRPLKSGFKLNLAKQELGFRPTSPEKALFSMRSSLLA